MRVSKVTLVGAKLPPPTEEMQGDSPTVRQVDDNGVIYLVWRVLLRSFIFRFVQIRTKHPSTDRK